MTRAVHLDIHIAQLLWSQRWLGSIHTTQPKQRVLTQRLAELPEPRIIVGKSGNGRWAQLACLHSQIWVACLHSQIWAQGYQLEPWTKLTKP